MEHMRGETYALAVGVVKGLELHNVGVAHDSHDLKLSVLPCGKH